MCEENLEDKNMPVLFVLAPPQQPGAYAAGLFPGWQSDPADGFIAAPPGELAFGVMAGVALDQGDGFVK